MIKFKGFLKITFKKSKGRRDTGSLTFKKEKVNVYKKFLKINNKKANIQK